MGDAHNGVAEYWLGKLSTLRVDPPKVARKLGPAPHKPLLLLILSQLVEEGRLTGGILYRDGDLIFRFSSYWKVVADRRRTRPDLRLPFYHLKGDEFWKPLTADGRLAASREEAVMAQIDMALLICLADPTFRLAARRTLIAGYFEPTERAELYALFEIETPPEDVIAADAQRYLPSAGDQRRRDVKFAVRVLTAYDYTCALCGYRMIDTRGNSALEAAHIHQFKGGGPCHPANGLALTQTAHWLFDRGFWTISDDCRVLVTGAPFDERGESPLLLKPRAGQLLYLPTRPQHRPAPEFLRWHRQRHGFAA